ncbi:MAG: 3-methyl-2-oxobutanoate hydroxymethyltransferase [bacterium]|nr:3-methyl-2-oxobutanoate hydroxymethyltransferase [bacterium]
MVKVLINDITAKKGVEPIVCITAYDYPTARIVDDAGVDLILVGDTVGMVVQGRENTLSVTVGQMVYHTEMVTRAAKKAFVVSDMPFMSYQSSVEDGLRNVGRLIKEGGAAAVKFEGATDRTLQTIEATVEAGIPVFGHVGYTPQSANIFGKKIVRGKNDETARLVISQAIKLEEAGCFAVVLEMVPRELSAVITRILNVPTIGIGSGPECDGQIIVWHDLLGSYFGYSPKFVRALANLKEVATDAVNEYAELVRTRSYPDDSESASLHEGMRKELIRLEKEFKR